MLENMLYDALRLLMKPSFRSLYFSRSMAKLSTDECESYKSVELLREAVLKSV